MTNTPIRILLDNGIFSHSEFAEGVEEATSLLWGNKAPTFLHGFVRKDLVGKVGYLKQMEALFTVGRLIREGRIEAYDYNEIRFERARGSTGLGACNALHGCKIHSCRPALERSKFMRTLDFRNFISKGGKKDRERVLPTGDLSQIAFFKWLCALGKEHIEALIPHAATIGLTAFEIESLKNIEWFRFICQRSGSPENYPDVFHLWTAERNGLDAVLTLDKGLQNLVSRVRNERVRKFGVTAEVLRPLDLLQKLGIGEPDPVPIGANRFYHWHELV